MLWEKTYPNLNEAIQTLISSDTSLSDRLDNAITSLTLISEKDLPITIRKEFEHLIENIEAYRNSGNRPELQAGLANSFFAFFKIFMIEGWPPTIPLVHV